MSLQRISVRAPGASVTERDAPVSEENLAEVEIESKEPKSEWEAVFEVWEGFLGCIIA